MTYTISAYINKFSDTHVSLNLYCTKTVYLWDSVPWTVKEWSSPRDQILLLRARILSPQSWPNNLTTTAVTDNPLVVSRPPNRSTNSVSSSMMTTSKIAIRYGGDQGLACYSFKYLSLLMLFQWMALYCIFLCHL